MKIIFEDRFGKERVVKTNVPKDEVTEVISAYVKELNPNYKIPYMRWWCSNNGAVMHYDVGSHSEFFRAEED